VRAAHQFITYAVATPFQHAMAAALQAPDDYYRELGEGYRARRDRLCEGLTDIGFVVAVPSGTYFANADIRALGFEDDVAFCRVLPERVQVAAIPLSAFLMEGGPRHMVRFAFAKDLATLDEAIRRLRRLPD
jgi:N-succinyldiaminopimelate aminotransferase